MKFTSVKTLGYPAKIDDDSSPVSQMVQHTLLVYCLRECLQPAGGQGSA